MFLQQVINGLVIGSTYALVAIGYSMVFGVLRLVNFAHSAVFMLGGYLAAVILGQTQSGLLTVAGAIAACTLAGFSIDRFALKPMRRKGASRISYLICTIGLSTVIQNLIFLTFGSEPIVFDQMIKHKNIHIGNAVVSHLQITILVIVIFLMFILSWFIANTKIGRAMRAISQNEQAARIVGIDVNFVITVTFMIGSGLAAVAGIFIGMYYRNVDLMMGFAVGMKTFAAAVLGGIGVMEGAVLGGLIIGILESLFAGYVSASYKDAVAFFVLILVLLIKPSGILGKKIVDKV